MECQEAAMRRLLRTLLTKVFARPVCTIRRSTPSPAAGRRARLSVTNLEDRIVPGFGVVEVTILDPTVQPVEGGTDGVLQFTRSDTSGSLTVNYTVGGTATPGTDYTALGGTVTFASGASTANVSVHALHDGVIDPGETVVATVASGSGYDIGASHTATVTIIDTDILPDAYDDLVTTPQNQSVNVSVIDLATSPLWNDALTVTAVTQGGHGSVSLSGGTATYTPNSGFTGDDTFTYTVEDPFGNQATGTVTVRVTGPQAPPTSVWTAQNTAVSVSIPELAFDPSGGSLTTTAVTQGSHGSVSINGDGSVTYTPGSTFTGDDSFTYTVTDAHGNTATGTITVTVGPTDPVALDDTVTTAASTAVNVAVLDLAYQPAGGSLSTTAVTQGAHGSVAINGNGTVTYTPASGYTGTDTFTYTVTDANSRTGTATITVTVGTPAPTAADEINDDLEEIQDELENPTDETPEAVADALPTITSALNDYLSDATSYIDAKNIDSTGSLKSFKEFEELGARNYSTLYADYVSMLGIESGLKGLMLLNKAVIDSYKQQLTAAQNAAQPNAAEIARLQGLLRTARLNQSALFRAYENWWGVTEAARNAALAWKYGPQTFSSILGLPDPPAHPDYDITPYIE
jgi:hypothetical protein